MDLGEKIRERRKSQHYSQKELAEKTGLTLRTIQRIENNEVSPSLHSLRVIGEVLQTDFSSLADKGAQPYEFSITLKIIDMNTFVNDVKILLKKHGKTIALILVAIWLISNYTDIKAGIIDGWENK